MAEPARRLDDEPDKRQVYDTSGTAPSDPIAQLKALEGGGETTEPKRGHLKSADRKDISQDLAGQESSPSAHDNPVGRGYKPSEKSLGSFFSRNLRGRKSKWILGAGGVGGIGLISFFLFFLPTLRLESYLSTINDRVFATASNAVQQRVEHLFEGYMSSYVLGLDKCGGKVSLECRPNYSGNIASSLYKSWQDAKIEQTLFDKYHFELISLNNPSTADGASKYVLKDPFGRRITLTNGELRNGNFTGGSREFGNEINDFLRKNTRWYDIMQRRSVRKYMVRKHGVKFWCFFACKTKDAIDLKISDAKVRYKYKFIERFVYPFSPKYGLILECITSGSADNCTADKLDRVGLDRSAISDADLEDIQKAFKDKPNLKLSEYLTERLLIKIGMQEATAKSVASAVPFVGQLYLGLSALDGLEQMKQFVEDGKLSQMAAEINSTQYLEFYAGMRSANDEMKSGVLSADDVGALVSQFDDGGRPAEQSLVYQAYTDTGSKQPVALGNGIALAATQTSQPTYTCDNGQPIPPGQYVCSEKTLNQRTYKIEGFFKDNQWIIDSLDAYDHCYGVSIGICVGAKPSIIVHKALKGINWVINGTLGTILNAALSVISKLPGISNLMDYVSAAAAKIINAIFNEVFPLPIQPDSPGREKYDGLEAGGEIAASEFNKGGYTDDGQQYGLGGRLLTTQEQVNATEAYLQQEQYENNHSNLITRMTNLANPDSLGSRFVAAMPTSFIQLREGVISLITNPFRNISFSKPAFAATNTAAINAFGVQRFGYTANDAAFTADPSLYTPEYCQQLEQKWEASKTQDPVTGVDEYSITNPCLLEQVSVEAASSIFTGDDGLND
jgi:hypothetical protein